MAIKAETYWYFGQLCPYEKLRISIPVIGSFWIGMQYEDIEEIFRCCGSHRFIRYNLSNEYHVVDYNGKIILKLFMSTPGVTSIKCDNINDYIESPDRCVNINGFKFYSDLSVNNTLLWLKSNNEIKLKEMVGFGSKVNIANYPPYPKFDRKRADNIASYASKALSYNEVQHEVKVQEPEKETTNDNVVRVDLSGSDNSSVEISYLEQRIKELSASIKSLKSELSSPIDSNEKLEAELIELKDEYDKLKNRAWDDDEWIYGHVRLCDYMDKVSTGVDGFPVLNHASNRTTEETDYEIIFHGRILTSADVEFDGEKYRVIDYDLPKSMWSAAEERPIGRHTVPDRRYEAAKRVFDSEVFERLRKRSKEIEKRIEEIEDSIRKNNSAMNKLSYKTSVVKLKQMEDEYGSLKKRLEELK